MHPRKEKVLKRLCIVILMIFLVMHPGKMVYASEVGQVDEFNNLEGDAKYLGKDYVDNYYLDIEKTDMFDTGEKMMNGIANALFSFYKTMSKLVCSIFYFAMEFDINDILGTQINGIQKALRNGIFTPLFTLAFSGAAFIMIKRLLKRDVSGVLGEMGKVIVLVVLSCLVVTKSSTVLSYTTKATKEVATGILIDMNTEMGIKNTSGTSYAAEAAGVLWVNLIHEPWKSMEFGKFNPKEEIIESFLSAKPGSDKRKELVEEYEKEHEGTFSKTKGTASIGILLAYFIPFIIKGGLYIIVAVIQLVFQLVALFLMILAPIILLLAMLPGYESIVTSWLKKMLETQISILIITFVMALMIKLDMSLYSLIPKIGWYVCMFLQVGLSFGLFLERNKILQLFVNFQRSIGNPSMMQRQLRMIGNPYKGIQNVQSGVKRVKVALKNSMKDDKLQFVNPSSKKSEQSKGENNKKQVNRPVTVKEQKSSEVHQQDYYATKTQYNMIDTNNIHEIWENAVPKSELKNENQVEEKKIQKRPVMVSNSNRSKTINQSSPRMGRSDEKKLEESGKSKFVVKRPVTYSRNQTKTNSLNNELVADSTKSGFINSKESSNGKRPSTVEQEQSKNVAGNTPQQIEKKEVHSYNGVPDRPILLNGEPIERNRPTTGKKKYYSNEELKKMSTKKLKEVAMDKAYEYYSSENCHINLGNTLPKEAVNSLMAQKRSKTSMIKDIMAMQKIQANEEVERAVGVERNLQAPQKRPSTASENSKSGKKISKEKKNRKKSSTDVSKKPVEAKKQFKVKM